MIKKVLILMSILGSAACGGSSTSPSTTAAAPAPAAAAPAGSTTVTIVSGASVLSSTAYSPSPVNVAVGTTVSFLNSDSTTHTSAANNGAWTSPNIAPGGRFNVTLTTAGTFPYRCAIHPNMVGTITVQ